jgi:ankyrin repeat protein
MLTRPSSVTRVRANPPFGVALARRAGPRRALPRVSAAASSSPAGAPRPSQASSRASKPDRHFSFDQNHDAQFLHWLDDLRVAAEKETWSAIPALVRFPRAEPGVALALAARAGQSRLVRTILASRGEAIDASDLASAGVAAAARGRVAVLEALLENGLAPDAVDEHGVAVLTVAAGAGPGPNPSPARTSPRGDDERALGDGETNLLGLGDGETNLGRPAHLDGGGPLSCVAALLAAGADPNAASSARGWKPAHAAAKAGDVDALRTLLEHGADPGARYPNGKTPLFLAAEWGRLDAVRALLAAGADAGEAAERLCTNHEAGAGSPGVTPAEVAAANGHDDVARLLRGAARGETARDAVDGEASDGWEGARRDGGG